MRLCIEHRARQAMSARLSVSVVLRMGGLLSRKPCKLLAQHVEQLDVPHAFLQGFCKPVGTWVIIFVGLEAIHQGGRESETAFSPIAQIIQDLERVRSPPGVRLDDMGALKHFRPPHLARETPRRGTLEYPRVSSSSVGR